MTARQTLIVWADEAIERSSRYKKKADDADADVNKRAWNAGAAYALREFAKAMLREAD